MAGLDQLAFGMPMIADMYERGRESAMRRRSEAMQQQIGAALSGGDYGAGARTAYQFGDIDTGSGLAKLAFDMDQQRAKSEQQKQLGSMLGQFFTGGGSPQSLAQLAQENPDASMRLYAAMQQRNAQQEAQNRPPAGFRWTNEGNLQPIKGGPQDPSRPMPARALRPTGEQNNAAGFYDRMMAANQVIGDPAAVGAAQDYIGKAKANLPFGLGNYLADPNFQRFDQAQRDFVNAVLRKESGAAISESEFENASKQYFPQPGDGPEVLAQKARNRDTAVAAMKRTAAGALLQGQPEVPQAYPGADGITGQDMGGGFTVPGSEQQFPMEAIEMLTADPSPEARAEFDAIFGDGASSQLLGQ